MIKKSIATLALLVGLLACGGGSTVTEPVPEKPNTFYLETSKIGGYIQVPTITCPSKVDPETQFGKSFITGDWGVMAGLDGTSPLPDSSRPGYVWNIDEGIFKFDVVHKKIGIYSTEGFALITSRVYDKNKPMTLKMQARLAEQSTHGAFVGITLIAGEGDYREISYNVIDGEVIIMRTAPCEVTYLKKSNYDWNDLELRYDPVIGWTYVFNGEVLLVEPMSAAGAPLTGNPRVGLYFAAIVNESRSVGYIRNVEILEE